MTSAGSTKRTLAQLTAGRASPTESNLLVPGATTAGVTDDVPAAPPRPNQWENA